MARNVANVEVLPVANVANGQLGRRGLVAGVGARPLRGTGALAKTNKTSKTPRNVPGMCGAPRIGGPVASGLSRVPGAQAF